MLLTSQSYKDFLSQELLRRSQANPNYSQRSFAKQLNLSAGELSEILRGKRKLSLKSALRIAKALELNAAEKAHLLSLVQNQKTEQWEAEIGTTSGKRRSDHLDKQQLSLDMFALVSQWYCFAILTLSECEGFRWDETYIAKRLGITALEARDAIHRLKKLGLIIQHKDSYKVSENYVVSPDGIPSEAIRNYHRQILGRAARALDLHPVSEREISGITFAVHPRLVPALKKDIALFLDNVATKYGTGKKNLEVYQLELALFKLSEGK